MSDFSLFSLFTAGLAFASGVAAYTKPVGDSPKGNPISQPGFMSVVPAGKPFTVTWEPTTEGTVTLVLLKGPSENAVPQYPIVEKIDNSGAYAWTPSKDLEPTEGAEGYGIQLIVDKNGQYQYTTQFGISNPNYKPEDSSSTSEDASTSTVAPTGYGNHGNGQGHHGQHGGWGHGGHNVHGGYTHTAASGTASGLTSSYTHKSNGTTSAHGHPTQNVTMVQPTGGYTSKPIISNTPTATRGSGASASASESGVPEATGNAASMVATSLSGLVLAAGAVVFAL